MAPTAAEALPLFRGCVRASGLVAVGAAAMVALAGCETLPQDQSEPEVAALPIVEPAAPGTLALAERALSESRHEDAGRLIERVLIAEPENWEAQLLFA